ncbi:MAG: anthranilate synthase component I family protein [Leptospirales bacterium]
MSTKTLPKIKLPLKPRYKKILPGVDFFELFKKIDREYENCFILESLGEESSDSRYCVIGFDPETIIRSKDGKLFVNEEEYETENPYYALREMIPDDIICRNYAGGLVGYLGYDAANYFEPALDILYHPDYDVFKFGLYTDGLIYDMMTGDVSYFYYTKDRSAILEEISEKEPAKPVLTARKTGDSKTEAEHNAMVEEAIEEIINGNTFQCQIGYQTNFELEGNPVLIYEKLRTINPSPHMFYLKFGETKLIGASPELLFRLRQGEVETFPLAGTTRRGKTPEEDRELAKALLTDPKEIAEHNMLVDLHRNDLGRLARFGSVKVRRLMDVKRFSHVQHISSEVVGLISKEDDMFTGLAKVFPAGTLSGAPKIESMKIINQIEQEPRGPYGGSVGHFGFNGDSFHVIPIRTLFVKGKNAFSRASGGIVYDSTPDGEYEEIQRKSAAVIRALEEFLIENEEASK